MVVHLLQCCRSTLTGQEGLCALRESRPGNAALAESSQIFLVVVLNDKLCHKESLLKLDVMMEEK